MSNPRVTRRELSRRLQPTGRRVMQIVAGSGVASSGS